MDFLIETWSISQEEQSNSDTPKTMLQNLVTELSTNVGVGEWAKHRRDDEDLIKEKEAEQGLVVVMVNSMDKTFVKTS